MHPHRTVLSLEMVNMPAAGILYAGKPHIYTWAMMCTVIEENQIIS
uniref:Uncharacterized protein n=1 Tax=Arundo donax TaxID=35708 RepID=A0A0A9EL76_ARUDO